MQLDKGKKSWAALVAAVLSLLIVQALSQAGGGDSQGIISQGDLQALLDIKAALLDVYEVLSSWNATSGLFTACSGSWAGVKCSQGKVVALQLPGQGLGGSIPDQVGDLTDLQKLDLHSNAIGGSIPQPLASLHNLRVLNLAANYFSGMIPNGLGINSVVLQSIDLSHNQLVGSIPVGLTSSPRLAMLNLSANHLSGAFPQDWSMNFALQSLDVSNNFLSGSLPSSWGGFTMTNSSGRVTILPQLHYFDASYNLLTGTIPASLADFGKLKLLNLKQNRIEGSIPSELGKMMSLEKLVLSHNALNGSIPSELGDLARLSVLDLGDNSLHGSLPSSLGSLENLRTLIVARNHLSGSIPPAMANLSLLGMLDMSSNNLNGTIPEAFAQLDNLTSLDLSNNHLQGAVPPFKHRFSVSSFSGNAGLCGSAESLPACSPPSAPHSKASPSSGSQTSASGSTPHKHIQSRRNHGSRFGLVTILCIAISSGLAVGAAACMGLFLLWRSVHSRKHSHGDGESAKNKQDSEEQIQRSDGSAGAGKLVLFEGTMSFTANDLLSATAEVMGKTPFGTDYKATLEDGSAITVKRLREGIMKNQEEFEAEVNKLGRIRHPNLLALRAYYWGPKNEKLLLFDHMPLGSLAAFLHARAGSEKPAGWITRAKIAVGAARGLHYLHEQENLTHGNLTSSIILLDANLNATISEYGLSRLTKNEARSTMVATDRALGYRAPELGSSDQQPTPQSDVYSFGILLLELLTGKAPGEAISSDGAVMDLPDFVSSVEEENWTWKVFDPELMERSEVSTEPDLLNTLQLALRCVALSPTSRPTMSEVMHHLEDVAH